MSDGYQGHEGHEGKPGRAQEVSDGTCPTCGAPLARQTDRRRARGYSLRCTVGGHTSPHEHGSRTTRPRVGTKNWVTDPSLPVCPVEGCFFDRGTCGHRRRKN